MWSHTDMGMSFLLLLYERERKKNCFHDRASKWMSVVSYASWSSSSWGLYFPFPFLGTPIRTPTRVSMTAGSVPDCRLIEASGTRVTRLTACQSVICKQHGIRLLFATAATDSRILSYHTWVSLSFEFTFSGSSLLLLLLRHRSAKKHSRADAVIIIITTIWRNSRPVCREDWKSHSRSFPCQSWTLSVVLLIDFAGSAANASPGVDHRSQKSMSNNWIHLILTHPGSGQGNLRAHTWQNWIPSTPLYGVSCLRTGPSRGWEWGS